MLTQYEINYNRAKLLEHELLNYLNMTQPIQYYDVNTQSILPMRIYYPSMYRYSSFDIYNEYTTFELKSRTEPLCALTANLLDTNKVIGNHSIFLYTYNNNTNILNNLHYIPYNPILFDTFTIQTTKKNATLYLIPTDEPTFIKMDMYNTHAHQIVINYTDDYKEQLSKIIANDTIKFYSTFGYHAIC